MVVDDICEVVTTQIASQGGLATQLRWGMWLEGDFQLSVSLVLTSATES